jgi:adenosine kinase
MPKRIFVSGSLAYDRIMDFPGRFGDHIMPDKIHILNVSFTVNSMVERPGGTAGNIAYALTLLGEQPTIMATVGHDHHRYFKWLDIHGISTDGIRVIDEEFTASAYITTDQADNQITGFNPGAMKHASEYDLSEVDVDGGIAIIAAGNLDDMIAYRDFYHARDIAFIFDPAQSLPMWEAESLTRCLEGARVLISNDYELELIMKNTGLDKSQLLERTQVLVTTKGEEGSVITTRDGEVKVHSVKLSAAPVDPTGAGDAYRGGLVRGMVTGKDLVECARLGSVCASFAVEVQGTQSYTFTMEQFAARYRETYDA